MNRTKFPLCTLMLCLAACAGAAEAGTSAETAKEAMFTVNNLWIMIAAMLVFIMNLGFATVESGLARAKNCTNILFKNLMVPAIGILTFALCGFSLMYPEGHWTLSGILGWNGFGLAAPAGAPEGYNGTFTYWTMFFFQSMFAATAATIVSGAVAERIKLNAFLIFTLLYAALVYPVIGSWGWGGGFLDKMHFHDFAGSTFVHSVGGWGALAGVILLGPRIGKFVNGHSMPIMGHSMPLATIGVFLLWFGWFGFNGGSVLSADPEKVSYVLVTTTLGAVAGIVAAMLASTVFLKKPDLSMTLNGCLAGLVGITPGCGYVDPWASVVIGAVAAAVCYFGIIFMRSRSGIDDALDVMGVHGFGGIWGAISVGIFAVTTYGSTEYGGLIEGSLNLLGGQVASVIITLVYCFVVSFVIMKVIDLVMKRFGKGAALTESEQMVGADTVEHGEPSYVM